MTEDHVAIPIPISSEDDEPDYLEYIKGFRDELRPALDLKVDDGDCRTTYLDHEFTDATMAGDQITIDYEVTTDTYYGCKDIDSLGSVWRAITGTSNGAHWIFPHYTYPDDRSTFEEF
ncbi:MULTISPECIES: hypothetical protein [unclassified Cyanobium]|uniref:hypothetical protein n=1 Tax=unclassified Cyanobium TaxID=2627006 RepID=UPI0020CBE364|nr:MULTISPECIES: hypothetical protein [unclassified Cyanobium]MCP9859834.1 hypothetical protein [Cyanobium sp. Cruz-8H5]MCP9866892.1 hypothetical protein [Cyanobium sp. Cruz-8D1]